MSANVFKVSVILNFSRQVKYTVPSSLTLERFLFTFNLSELTHRMKQVISSDIKLIFVGY